MPGCHLAGAAAAAVEAAPAAQPPQLMRGGAAPQLRVPRSISSNAQVRVDVEVMVNEAGQPDMRTFKATGSGAAENHDALQTWIQAANFRPARLGGRSVPGLFKTRLEASIRRM